MSEIDEVIENGYCIGCSACTLGQSDASYRVSMSKLGFYEASKVKEGVSSDRLDELCPFTNVGLNESEIAEKLWSGTTMIRDQYVGLFRSLYAGHVAQEGFRGRGSSGGFGSWILAELLNRGLVDAVIHVKKSKREGLLYEFGVSKDLDSLNAGAKSHYYPVEMSGILRYIRENAGRYAVVGVPCFIKALRKLMLHETVFKERISYCIGLFCGHLKGKGFAESLAFQCGVRPNELTGLDFRKKIAGRSSTSYGITATGVENGKQTETTRIVSELEGTDWGMGFFKYKACDYCDDLSAETADVSIGDAWLPKYTDDSMGTNVVIVRNPEIGEIVEDGIESGVLNFEPLLIEDVIKSQSANVRHRREELPYRLKIEDSAGRWRPRKRVTASDLKLSTRRNVQDQRMWFRDNIPLLWEDAVSNSDCESFFKLISPRVRKYQNLYARPFHRRLIGRIFRMMKIEKSK